jgi:hypothetical protein
MPEAPPQVSSSDNVPFLFFGTRTVTLTGPTLDAVNVTEQGVTRTPPWAVQPPLTFAIGEE